jgi:hypothetical protein
LKNKIIFCDKELTTTTYKDKQEMEQELELSAVIGFQGKMRADTTLFALKYDHSNLMLL